MQLEPRSFAKTAAAISSAIAPGPQAGRGQVKAAADGWSFPEALINLGSAGLGLAVGGRYGRRLGGRLGGVVGLAPTAPGARGVAGRIIAGSGGVVGGAAGAIAGPVVVGTPANAVHDALADVEAGRRDMDIASVMSGVGDHIQERGASLVRSPTPQQPEPPKPWYMRALDTMKGLPQRAGDIPLPHAIAGGTALTLLAAVLTYNLAKKRSQRRSTTRN